MLRRSSDSLMTRSRLRLGKQRPLALRDPKVYSPGAFAPCEARQRLRILEQFFSAAN